MANCRSTSNPRVLQPDPHGRRRVVLATNVAESSVTLPGVRVVIDSGLAREPRYDPNSGFARLDVVNIAQASADQRAGRAGRVAAGWAYRLWPQSQRLEPQRRAGDPAGRTRRRSRWNSPPGAATRCASSMRRRAARWPRHATCCVGSARSTAAITPHHTRFGRRMLALGTHPRLAAMLLAPRDDGERALACDLAALLEARDPLRSRSDALADRWQALAAFRNGRVPADANRGALAAIDAAAKQWRRRLRLDAAPPASAPAHLLGDLLLHAFPDRIARQHPGDPRRYQLANGRMARLFDDSALYGEPWIVASELRFEAKDALLLRGAPLDEARLQREFPQRFVEQDVVRWDPSRRALLAQREQRFDAIVLATKPAGRVDPAQAARALTDAVRELGLDALPWSESLSQWRARVRCLRAWMPELALPDLSDAALAGHARCVVAAGVRRQDPPRRVGRRRIVRSVEVVARLEHQAAHRPVGAGAHGRAFGDGAPHRVRVRRRRRRCRQRQRRRHGTTAACRQARRTRRCWR